METFVRRMWRENVKCSWTQSHSKVEITPIHLFPSSFPFLFKINFWFRFRKCLFHFPEFCTSSPSGNNENFNNHINSTSHSESCLNHRPLNKRETLGKSVHTHSCTYTHTFSFRHERNKSCCFIIFIWNLRLWTYTTFWCSVSISTSFKPCHPCHCLVVDLCISLARWCHRLLRWHVHKMHSKCCGLWWWRWSCWWRARICSRVENDNDIKLSDTCQVNVRYFNSKETRLRVHPLCCRFTFYKFQVNCLHPVKREPI